MAPITFLGILSAVLLAIGLIPPYIELWKHQGRVIGLSFRFLAIDFSGAFFSLMALVAQEHFDVLGGVSYISVMVMEIGIVSSHLIWFWRTRYARKRAHELGKDYDTYVNSLDAGDTVFVKVDDVPNEWTKSLRVSAILKALQRDEEKGHEPRNRGPSTSSASTTSKSSTITSAPSDGEKHDHEELPAPTAAALRRSTSAPPPSRSPTPFDGQDGLTRPKDAHTATTSTETSLSSLCSVAEEAGELSSSSAGRKGRL